MAALVVIQGQCEHPVYEVPDGGDLAIGRSLSNALVLDGPAVSRHHARVFKSGAEFWVEDLNSSNGTRVNGESATRQALSAGDLVEIGHFRFRFETAVTSARRRGADTSGVVLTDDRAEGAPDAKEGQASKDRPGSAVLARVDTHEVATANLIGAPEQVSRRLRLLTTFVRGVGALLDLDQVVDKVLDALPKIFEQTERAAVVLIDPETGEETPQSRARNRTPHADQELAISRTIVEEAMREGQGILMADSASDERFSRAASVINLKIRSAMCVPLVSRSRTHGILYIDTTSSKERFIEDDLHILVLIGGQAAVAVENASLHTQVLAADRRRKDLERAGEVQRQFLPKTVPSIPDYEFFVHYSPAYEVGGDFYDFIELPDGGVAVVLGDVSGKGFPAAMLMAKLITDIRHTVLTKTAPGSVLDRVNQIMALGGSEGSFVTLLYLALDPAANRCAIVNAGHMAPIVRRADGRLEEPDAASGLPLGVLDTSDYGPDVIDLAPGDSLLLYTDGISEARSAAEQYYTTDRLRTCVTGGPFGAAALGQHVLDDVKRFVGATVQSDDITLVGFGRSA